MQSVGLTELSNDEMLHIDGGIARYGCALIGGLTAAAFLAGQWWAVAGGLVAAYNSNCFE